MIPIRFSTRRIGRLAERAVAGPPLRRRDQQRLARALNASERDREAYHRLVGLVCAFEGTTDLSLAQRGRILEQSTGEATLAEAPTAGAFLRRLVPAAVVLLLVVTAVALFAPSPSDEFQHRGSEVAITTDGLVGLKAHCVRDGMVVPPPSDDIHARCRLSDELQLSISHTAGYQNLLVVGLHEDGGDLWYFPVPPTGRSAPPPRKVEDEPLGEAIRLSVNHRPGAVRLLAVFSRRELEADRLFAGLKSLQPTEPAQPWIRKHLVEKTDRVTVVELRVKIEGGAP